jgi:hypothetical protein
MLNVRFIEISLQATGDEAVVQRPAAAARPGRRNISPAGAMDNFDSLHCTTTTTTNNNNNNNNKPIYGTEFFMRS